jgi:hypothetical protein
MGTHLEAQHPSVYKVGGKIVGWISYGLEKIGEGTDELMRITAETSLSAIGQKPGFANQARDYTLGSIGQYLEENTDQQFQKGVGVAAAAAAWIPGLGGIAKRVPSPVSKEAFESLVQNKIPVIKSKLDQSASSSVNGLNLKKSLASEQQLAAIKNGDFSIIAGYGSDKSIKDISRLTATYGGKPNEWSKIRSTNYVAPDGKALEIHAYRNMVTGQIVEPKSKIVKEKG